MKCTRYFNKSDLKTLNFYTTYISLKYLLNTVLKKVLKFFHKIVNFKLKDSKIFHFYDKS